jgi:hypothetical protein
MKSEKLPSKTCFQEIGAAEITDSELQFSASALIDGYSAKGLLCFNFADNEGSFRLDEGEKLVFPLKTLLEIEYKKEEIEQEEESATHRTVLHSYHFLGSADPEAPARFWLEFPEEVECGDSDIVKNDPPGCESACVIAQRLAIYYGGPGAPETNLAGPSGGFFRKLIGMSLVSGSILGAWLVPVFLLLMPFALLFFFFYFVLP